MIPKVKITRVIDEEERLASITFKSKSLPAALESAAVVMEALGPEFEYGVKYKLTAKGNHCLTLK